VEPQKRSWSVGMSSLANLSRHLARGRTWMPNASLSPDFQLGWLLSFRQLSLKNACPQAHVSKGWMERKSTNHWFKFRARPGGDPCVCLECKVHCCSNEVGDPHSPRAGWRQSSSITGSCSWLGQLLLLVQVHGHGWSSF